MEQNQKKYRNFGLTSISVDNATSVILLTFLILGAGMFAYNAMPKEQFPEISLPTVYINTMYPGNSAADMENLVTRPIEKEVNQITGLKKLQSTSLQDFSVILAEFETDVDIDLALDEVKDAVDKAKSELPNDLPREPNVFDVNFAELPIMTVNLSGDFGNDELRNYAEYLEDELEEVDDISDVTIKGALEREVKIDVDLYKMESMEISFRDIENAVAMENMTMSGGEVIQNGFRRAIRVVGEVETMQDLRDIIVKNEFQRIVYLKDIAEVSFGYKDRTSYARSNEQPVVSLDVVKEAGSNLLSTSDQIKAIVKKAQAEVLPKELEVNFFNDQSIQTRNEVSNLENSIISGVILVVMVLLFFLGLRNAMFVGVAIPLSMLMGILILYLMGITMNMVVLFSLILALGMLVDNGIVVVENIYRYMQEGFSPKEAAKKGASEVAMPIIVSTATTLAAFVPLAFWPGLMGSFMKFLPITLIIVLTSSLFVALVINPVLASKLMRVDEKADTKEERRKNIRNTIIIAALIAIIAFASGLGGIEWLRNLGFMLSAIILLNFFVLRPASFFFQNKILPVLENIYDKFVTFALKSFMPYVIFVGTFLLLFFSLIIFALNMPKTEFFPVADPLYVNVFVETPMGTDIEVTNDLSKELEKRITKLIEEKEYNAIVEAVLGQVGEGTSDPSGPPEPGASPNKARITVSFVPTQDRGGISTKKVMEEIREVMKGVAGVQIAVAQNQDGPVQGKPINLELKGENIDKLALLSRDVVTYLNSKSVAGVEELKPDVKLGKPEMIIHVDRDQARRYGVSTYDIANTIRTAKFGREVSKYKLGEDEYDIYLRANDEYKNSISALMAQKITFRNPANGQISQVPISTVASSELSSSYSSIKRKDLDRVITVQSNVLDGYNANEVVAELNEIMAEFDMPEEFTYEFTGEQQEQAENMQFLMIALLVAMFTIFLILVMQFNSVSAPFIIVFSVVFSMIGVFLGYVITGRDFVIIMTGVGIISLAGIVVNNAIVLVDYIKLLIRQKGEELKIDEEKQVISDELVKAAIIKAGATRLRPVLLTAITTVFGLVPLAIGFNFNFFTFVSELDGHMFIGGDNVAFWGPMAWTVIYGLVFATFLTLVVVPVMFWIFYKFKRLLQKMLGFAKEIVG